MNKYEKAIDYFEKTYRNNKRYDKYIIFVTVDDNEKISAVETGSYPETTTTYNLFITVTNKEIYQNINIKKLKHNKFYESTPNLQNGWIYKLIEF